MDENPRSPGRKVRIMAACLGFVTAAAIPVAIMLPELTRRWRWAHGGGRGETAVWSEPLFYMIVMGAFIGVVGAFAAGAIVRAAYRNK